ncbi:hypothetical protein [Deinococcus multiflagellatus]|uniref:Uncharacterized protein n=1 Tax=Deinococcus multiflagellatus TaxID=1656887 RepID=A0ABW1ZIU0_9DEIO
MFSLAPLLLIAVIVASRFLTNEGFLDQLFGTSGVVTQNLGPTPPRF